MSGEGTGSRPRRPTPLADIPERLAAATDDPATRADAAEGLALALCDAGRADAEQRERLVRLADEVGLDELDAAWRGAEPGSFAAALRVLYLLRAWGGADARGMARLLAAGCPHAEVDASVAGVPALPDAADVTGLVDDLLRGALGRDVATALHRAAALCRVLAAGRGVGDPTGGLRRPWEEAVLGARLLSTAEGLEQAAAALR